MKDERYNDAERLEWERYRDRFEDNLPWANEALVDGIPLSIYMRQQKQTAPPKEEIVMCSKCKEFTSTEQPCCGKEYANV